MLNGLNTKLMEQLLLILTEDLVQCLQSHINMDQLLMNLLIHFITQDMNLQVGIQHQNANHLLSFHLCLINQLQFMQVGNLILKKDNV